MIRHGRLKLWCIPCTRELFELLIESVCGGGGGGANGRMPQFHPHAQAHLFDRLPRLIKLLTCAVTTVGGHSCEQNGTVMILCAI